MSHKSWLNRFLKGVSRPSRSGLHKRPAFSPVRMEFLEDRTAPATLTWTGASGVNWSDAGNWTGCGVPSAANNVLNFTAGASVAKYRDAKLYRRLYAAPNLYGINAITESGNPVTVTTAAPGTTTQMNSSVKVGDQVLAQIA